MRSRVSAGLVLWRRGPAGIEVLLGHPGGPLFARRDAGYWTIPKGEVETAERAAGRSRPGRGRPPGVRRGDRPSRARWSAAPARVDRPEGRQGSIRMGRPGRPRPRGRPLEPVHDVVAAGVRPPGVVPGARSRGVVRPGRGATADQGHPDPAPRPARGRARLRGRLKPAPRRGAYG